MQGVIGELAHVLICYRMVSFKDCANLEHWFTLVVDCNDVFKISSKKDLTYVTLFMFLQPKRFMYQTIDDMKLIFPNQNLILYHYFKNTIFSLVASSLS
jgi:hypothetical protein